MRLKIPNLLSVVRKIPFRGVDHEGRGFLPLLFAFPIYLSMITITSLVVATTIWILAQNTKCA
jgi:hypothetical protein